MAAPHSMDLNAIVREHFEHAGPDVLRELLKRFAEALMSAEAQVLCNAEYGEVKPERTNRRIGYRSRDFDTRAGTIELAVPKLRSGSYFPDWLLSRRRRAEQALVSMIATSYVLGVSTRRVEKLCEALGIDRLSKSQVSEMAKSLDETIAAFRSRPLDSGPYRFLWADAMVVKVREQQRTKRLHVLCATGVNAEGYREVLGLDVTTEESGAGWLAFFRDLVARGLSGVALVTSDAHQGLVSTIGATLPGATWQRCRTHYMRDLLAKIAKSAQPWVATLVRTVFSQPDARGPVVGLDQSRSSPRPAPAGPSPTLGAGPGHVAAHLAARDVDAVAVDLSPAMCRLALSGAGIPAAAGDLTTLPLATGSVAGVVCWYALIHLDTPGRAAVYAEMARVTRPDGPVLVAFHTSDADHEPGTAKSVTEWWDHPVELTFRFLDPAAETALAAAAGLKLVARLDRQPHPGVEHPSARSYLLLTNTTR